MKIVVKRFFNHENIETGAVLTLFGVQCKTTEEKKTLEQILHDYAFNQLYKHKSLYISSSIHQDMPSITVLKDLNDLPEEIITLKS